MDFATITLEQALQVISTLDDKTKGANLLFFKGDHWQEGDQWVGPRPDPQESAAADMMSQIETNFVSQNVIKEVVNRPVGSLLGQEISFRLVPILVEDPNEPLPDDQIIEIAKLEEDLTIWWDERQGLLTCQTVLQYALLSDRGSLRIFIPDDEKDEMGVVSRDSFLEALRSIYVQPLYGDTAFVYTDPTTMKKASMYAYKQGDQHFVEMSYYDRHLQKTIWKVLGKDGIVQYAELDVNRRLMLEEISIERLISPQVTQNQNQINKTRSMLGRNAQLAGFRERMIFNGKPPTKVTIQADGTEVEEEIPMKVGPGVINYIVGQEYTDVDGRTQVLSPSVQFQDPISPTSFIETIQAEYLAILREVQQLHAVITGDSQISGYSRRQALIDYATYLSKLKPAIDNLGRWLFSMLVSLAGAFSGRTDLLQKYRVEFLTSLDLGPLSPEELDIIIKLLGSGIYSLERSMRLARVEDTTAEKKLILQEKKESASLLRSAGAALMEQISKGDSDEDPTPEDDNGE